MFRYALSFFFVFFLALSVCCTWGTAQENAAEQPKPVKPAPEVQAFANEIEKALPQDNPNTKSLGLFRLLNFQLGFEDKTSAKETLNKLLTLAPSVMEPQQTQLYEGIAVVYADLGQFADAVKLVAGIKQPDARTEAQLNLADKIAKDENNNYNVDGLLKQAVASAEEAKNVGTQTLAQVFLGKELARQKKLAEAITLFAEARKNAKKLEEVEEQNIVGLMIRTQIEAGLNNEALENLKSITEPEVNENLSAVAASSFIRTGKTAEAEKLLQTIPAGEKKDQYLVSIANVNIKTLTAEQVKLLEASMSSPERKTKFLQGVAGAFINLDKDEEAKKLADGNKEILNALKAKPIRQLLKDKKFDEALKVAETLDAETPDGERSKTQIKRQIGILRYRETNDEKYLQQIAATFTDEEKKQISELDNAVQQASAITNPEEQRTALLQAVQTQYQIGNVTGVKQVLVLLLANVEKETDVVKLVSQRLILARLQADVNDKAGMKANLGKLLEKLSGVKDIMELKELVPERQQENPIAAAGGEAVKLKVPVDRTAVEDQLFNVYITVADDFRKAEADAEAKAVLQKARQIAESATDAARKADMLFFMMQFLNQKN